MGTSEIVTSKEEKYKKMVLKDSGEYIDKFGEGKSHIKICCLSDTHQNHNNIKMPDKIDMMIYAGDFTNWKTSKKNSVDDFLDWFKKINAKYKILVCGNHELYFNSLKKKELEEMIEDLKKNNIFFLDNNFVIVPDINLNIYGFPQTIKRNIFYMADAYEVKGQKMNEICNKKFDKKMDILVTHSPPLKILDKTYKNKNIGSLAILEDLILRVKPKIHIFGHNHDEPGYQIYEFEGEKFLFVNASKTYGTKPIVFDYYYD
jgi:Icc-related predicted phosphoesterase